ncbi:MAG: helix-turn-helix domain-containing protein [Oscillospiraceae bacterium]
MLDANVVGSVLQRLREERGLSQEIVSGLAGIGRTHLSAIEHATQADAGDLYRIGEALHMRPSAGAGGRSRRTGQGAETHPDKRCRAAVRKTQKTGEQAALLFLLFRLRCVRRYRSSRGSTAGRDLRGADFRAWSARS